MNMPISISPGTPRVDADTAILLDDALTLLTKRRQGGLIDPDDVLTRIHLLASLRDQITAELAQAVDDAIADDRPLADIAIVSGTDHDTLNEHYNQDRPDTEPAHT